MELGKIDFSPLMGKLFTGMFVGVAVCFLVFCSLPLRLYAGGAQVPPWFELEEGDGGYYGDYGYGLYCGCEYDCGCEYGCGCMYGECEYGCGCAGAVPVVDFLDFFGRDFIERFDYLFLPRFQEIEEEMQSFTPDGAGTILDNFVNNQTGIEFVTIVTSDGHVFYLAIDRNRAANNVHFLRAVRSYDLIPLSEDLIVERDYGERDRADITNAQLYALIAGLLAGGNVPAPPVGVQAETPAAVPDGNGEGRTWRVVDIFVYVVLVFVGVMLFVGFAWPFIKNRINFGGLGRKNDDDGYFDDYEVADGTGTGGDSSGTEGADDGS